VTRVERFWSHVDKSGECWLWTAHRDKDGYGRHRLLGRGTRQSMAHRIAYEMEYGAIPDGLHLKPASIRENVLRGCGISAENARKTHCKRGHEFTAENTRLNGGSRVCRTCTREWAQRRYWVTPDVFRERTRRYRETHGR
jgi:hypothetical protein